jgi:hypothetical protein
VGNLSESRGGDAASQAENEVGSGAAISDDTGTVETTDGFDDAELFAPEERNELEQRWNEIQARFVDEPRGSVEEANALVAELMERLVSSFSEQRAGLEEQWDRGDDVTTEELRIAFRRYRSFFGRLLELGVER